MSSVVPEDDLLSTCYIIFYVLICHYRLLLYGICCCVNDKHSEAEEVLEFATAIEEYNTIAWTIRGDLLFLVYSLHSVNMV